MKSFHLISGNVWSNSPNYYLCLAQSTVCIASIILSLLILPFSSCSLFYSHSPKLHKNLCSQPEKFLSLVTTLTLPHWQERAREESDHQSQTNLHLSQVSWVLQFHTDPVFLHSNTRKTAKFATFQMEARLLNNDWLWKLHLNVCATVFTKVLISTPVLESLCIATYCIDSSLSYTSISSTLTFHWVWILVHINHFHMSFGVAITRIISSIHHL